MFMTPRMCTDLDTNRVDARGDISFDTKIFLTSEVSTNTTIFLKLIGGSLFLRSEPALVDLGNVKLSNPGEELVFFHDRTPASSGNKFRPTVKMCWPGNFVGSGRIACGEHGSPVLP